MLPPQRVRSSRFGQSSAMLSSRRRELLAERVVMLRLMMPITGPGLQSKDWREVILREKIL